MAKSKKKGVLLPALTRPADAMGTLSTPHLDDDASYLPVHIQYVCIPGTLVDGRPVSTQPEGWDGKCASGYMDTWIHA